MRYLFSLLLFFAVIMTSSAQVTLQDIKRDPRLSANNLCVYPADRIVALTPAPQGYEPCYLYMACRHGSRRHSYDYDYKKPMEVLAAAYNAKGLTSLGKETYQRVLNLYEEARGRYGMLTTVGEEQLRGIAQRMFFNYPQLFVSDACINAKSTTSQRVIFTMMAFCERMKELNPSLRISRNCDENIPGEWGTPTEKIKYEGSEWSRHLEKFFAENVDADAFCARLFKKKYLEEADFNRFQFMEKMFILAGIVQDTDVVYEDCQLYDAFTPEELFAFSKSGNYGHYVYYGASPETEPIKKSCIHDPMRLMVERVEAAFANGKPSATCLFCHDGNIGPWSTALGIKGMTGCGETVDEAAEGYCDSRVVPMATNIQFVFFRNAEGRILVKVLHCEREVEIPVEYAPEGAPFYDWRALKSYLLSL